MSKIAKSIPYNSLNFPTYKNILPAFGRYYQCSLLPALSINEYFAMMSIHYMKNLIIKK